MAKIKLLQVLCPSRHLIAALAFDAEKTPEAETKRSLTRSLARNDINGCRTCRTRDLRFEIVSTNFKTMAEAGRSIVENNEVSFVEMHKKIKPHEPVKTPLSKCTRCGEGIARNVGLVTKHPRPGDVSICVSCGEVMRFRADLTLRKISGDELTALKAHLRASQPEVLRLMEQKILSAVAARSTREN